MGHILFNTLSLPHQKARDTAEMIQDYDPELFLERLPEGHPWLIDNSSKPYALIHRPLGLPEYVIESFAESFLDERVLARVFEWDTRRFGKELSKFDALAHARRVAEAKSRDDRLGDDNERMAHLLKKRRWE